MKIEILDLPEYPSPDAAKLVIERALKVLGVDTEPTVQPIRDEKEAKETVFLGSRQTKLRSRNKSNSKRERIDPAEELSDRQHPEGSTEPLSLLGNARSVGGSA
jgi:hypothetical protein